MLYAAEIVAARDQIDKELIKVKIDDAERTNEELSATDTVLAVPGLGDLGQGSMLGSDSEAESVSKTPLDPELMVSESEVELVRLDTRSRRT